MEQLPNGQFVKWPITKQAAVDMQSRMYVDMSACKVCQREYPVRFTKTDRCATCRMNDMQAINDYMFNGKVLTIPRTEEIDAVLIGLMTGVAIPTANPKNCLRHGHLMVTNKQGRCFMCGLDDERPDSRKNAKERGDMWFMPSEHCHDCGTISPRRVNNSQCQRCEQSNKDKVLSPRQQAIADGETWYMPDTPCKRCNETALKRVSNGECQGCINRRPAPEPKPLTPRQQAIADGEKVYTPDNPCRRCHTYAPRDVNNGRCFGCIN